MDCKKLALSSLGTSAHIPLWRKLPPRARVTCSPRESRELLGRCVINIYVFPFALSGVCARGIRISQCGDMQ
jgi:hypothetical protein